MPPDRDPGLAPENALQVALEEEAKRDAGSQQRGGYVDNENLCSRPRDGELSGGGGDGERDDAPLLSGGGSRYLQRSLSHVKLMGDATMESLRQSSPIPVSQMAAICCTQLSQAIQVTLPYTIAVFMVRDFGYTDERQVSQKTGLMASYYCLAMLLTAYIWGKFSDRYGRKPVIVIGNTASAIAVLLFGFSPTYELACLSRFFGGFFNGLFGALKTMIGESCDASSQGQALVFLSISWGIGTTIGPVIGGFLARPCEKYDGMALCGDGELFHARPFLLPCLTAGVIQVLATLMSFLCMHETLPERIAVAEGGKDSGGLKGNGPSWRGLPSLSRALKLVKSDRGKVPPPQPRELSVLGRSEGGKGKKSADSSYESWSSTHNEGIASAADGEQAWWKQREVVLCLLGYGLIAFIFNLSDEVTPIFASAPESDGGLGLSTSQVGIPLTVSGVALLLYASLGFKPMQRRFGVLRLARFGLVLSFFVWLLHPVSSLLVPDTTGALVILSLAHVGKSIAGVSSFTSSMVLVNVASPSKQLGRVNGMGQSVAAFVRGVGPAAGGFIWALTLGTGLPYHQFIVYSGIALMSLATTAVYGSHLKIAALDGL